MAQEGPGGLEGRENAQTCMDFQRACRSGQAEYSGLPSDHQEAYGSRVQRKTTENEASGRGCFENVLVSSGLDAHCVLLFVVAAMRSTSESPL